MPSSATTHDHVQRMLAEIRQNYSQRLTLATLARLLRRQSPDLGRLFRDEIGITVHEYVTRARMVFGSAQVRAGVKIEAVALDLGYRSKKNFYRQFKRFFGMTPEAYRHDHNGPAADHPRQGDRRSHRVHVTSVENLLGERHSVTPRRSRKATVRPEPHRRGVRQKVGAAPPYRSPRV